MIDYRYYRRTEPTILGEDFMTFSYYDKNEDYWTPWDYCTSNRRTYEPIEDEV